MKSGSLILCVMLLLSGCMASVSNQQQTCLEVLHSFGVEADPVPVEETRMTLPEELTVVYQNYEEMIAKDGYTLIPYLGQEVTRLTFLVTNYPGRQDVRANLLVYQGEVIAGDLSTVSLYGFMHSFSDFPLEKGKEK